MRFLAVLAFYLILGLCQFSLAASSPEALQCITDFTKKFDEMSGGYRATMLKTEYINSAKGVTHKIEIRDSKKEIILKFLDEAYSGIKNNGMTIRYDSTALLKIKFGHSAGLGFLMNGAARLFAAKEIALTDSQALKGEVFTVNRAGLSYLAATLKKNLLQFQNGELGDLTLIEAPCKVRYKLHEAPVQIVDLKVGDSIFDIEEKFSTLAFILFKENEDQFKQFDLLFNRKKEIKMKISAGFTPFEIDIDPVKKMPTRFVLFLKDKIIGEYKFSDIESL